MSRTYFAIPLGYYYANMIEGAQPPVGYFSNGGRIFGPFESTAGAILATEAATAKGWSKEWLVFEGEVITHTAARTS